VILGLCHNPPKAVTVVFLMVPSLFRSYFQIL
jgi:hypothetical protein